MGFPCAEKIAVEPGDWIQWRGGECPVDGNVVVEVKFDSDQLNHDNKGQANHFSWKHSNEDYWVNIVAFRIVKES